MFPPLTLIACTLLLTAPLALAGSPQSSRAQQTRAIMAGKRLYLNWSKVEYRSDRTKNASWIELPHLGQINTLNYQIPSDKKKGSFKLPKKRYLDSLDDGYANQAVFGLIARYEYLDSGEFKLEIIDSIEEMDGYFAFTITIKWTSKTKGTATGTIFSPAAKEGMYLGEIRGLRCELR